MEGITSQCFILSLLSVGYGGGYGGYNKPVFYLVIVISRLWRGIWRV